MKNLFTAFMLLLILNNAKSQSLTIQETINYINKTHFDNKEANIYYYSISLASDGTFKVNHIGSVGSTYVMNISEVHVRMCEVFAGDNRICFFCYPQEPEEIMGKKLIGSGKPNYCIRYVSTATGAKIMDPYFTASIDIEDSYVEKKLANAYGYLFALVKENGNYVRKDDDPFAPGNYNPNSVQIKGNTQNSRVNLEMEGGVYYIIITIGTIKRRFILDSGASEVSLSESFANELTNAGIIRQEHYTTPALYKLADGSIIACKRLVLPEIKIGTYTVSNIRAVIVKGSSPLLLGKSLLDKFNRWSIENSTKTLILEK